MKKIKKDIMERSRLLEMVDKKMKLTEEECQKLRNRSRVLKYFISRKQEMLSSIEEALSRAGLDSVELIITYKPQYTEISHLLKMVDKKMKLTEEQAEKLRNSSRFQKHSISCAQKRLSSIEEALSRTDLESVKSIRRLLARL